MALQSPFFNNNNKRDPDPYAQRHGNNPNANALAGAVQPSQPLIPPAVSGTTVGTAAKEGESKLTVGPNIKLKGVEITDCDTLVVEGTVEATMDSRVIHIAEEGAFRGAAEIDIAEIYGRFDGDLTVRDKLMIFGTGRVSGKIRYGKLVIEEGGQLSGEIAVGSSTKPHLKTSPAPGTVAVPGGAA